MKYPLSLIKKYITPQHSAEEIGDILTNLGCEVEEISNTSFPFTDIVIGKIVSIAPHPNADALRILQVSTGDETHQLICKDPSAKENMIVAVALDGSTLPGITIKKTKLRDVSSDGMLPSEHELGVGPDNSTIYTLPHDAPLGTNLASYLYDPAYTIGFTPNLGHARSSRGLARELAAYSALSLNEENHTPSGTEEPTISINSQCEEVHQFVAQKMSIKIGPSPFWLRRVLQVAGLRSINNVVDVTNYVLLVLGQPMHAFDAHQIPNGSLELKISSGKGTLTTLDDQEIPFPKGVLLITDDQNVPLSFAGVMGGKKSSVTEETTQIILEAGTYDPSLIRKSSKLVGIRTASSSQFEQGTDPNLPYDAVNLAVSLLTQMGGIVKEKSIGLHQKTTPPHTVSCQLSRIQSLLGVAVPQSEVIDIFQRLGFTTQSDSDEIKVDVPAFRTDINQEIDLIEEVARIYGYNNIPHDHRQIHLSVQEDSPLFLIEKRSRDIFLKLGLQETIYCDLIDPKHCQSANYTQTIAVKHPKSQEQSVLRPSLLFGQIKGIVTNKNVAIHDYNAFEIGNIHYYSEGVPQERLTAAIMLSGNSTPYHYGSKPQPTNFYDLKGLIEAFFGQLTNAPALFTPSKEEVLHPNIQAEVHVNEHLVGYIGKVHPEILLSLDCESTNAFFAHLDLEVIAHLQQQKKEFTSPIRYPSSTRDATFSVDKDTQLGTVIDLIHKQNPPILRDVFCLDLYHDPNTPDRKNLTLRFIYQDAHKTLKDQYVEKLHTSLIKKIEEKISL